MSNDEMKELVERLDFARGLAETVLVDEQVLLPGWKVALLVWNPKYPREHILLSPDDVSYTDLGTAFDHAVVRAELNDTDATDA